MATIEGGAGNDLLEGTSETDVIYGYGGNDGLYATEGHDQLYGGEGDDYLDGGPDGGRLDGEAGADDIVGGPGVDEIYGGVGDDSLYGADGLDYVYGGEGDDIIGASPGRDFLDGGEGVDMLQLSFLSSFEHLRFNFQPHSGGTAFRLSEGGRAVGFERINISGGSGLDTLIGGAGDDQIRGWQSNDMLYGRDGNDFLIGDNGRDVVDGGRGNDFVTGNGDSDTLIGGLGDDTLIGGTNSDLFTGDDLLEGGLGADTFRAGKGRTDITYANGRTGVYVDFSLGVGFGGEAQGDRLGDGNSGIIRGRLIGTAFDDYLVGGNLQFGGEGDDRLTIIDGVHESHGGAGADTFALRFTNAFYGTAAVIMDFNRAEGDRIDLSAVDARPALGFQTFRFIGGDAFSGRPGELRYELTDQGTRVEFQMDADPEGDFWIFLSGVHALEASDFGLAAAAPLGVATAPASAIGSRTTAGGEGPDRLIGGPEDDTLSGLNGDDRLSGGPGDDSLLGGGGDDTLFGGSGNDTLTGGRSFDVMGGDDVLDGGPGADLFRPGLGRTDISYTRSREGVFVDLLLNLAYGGDAQGDRFDPSGSNGFRGALIGSAYADHLIGGEVQIGGGGDDRLTGSEGTLRQSGGEGADTFVFRFVNGAGPAGLIIEDFSQAEGDRIDIRAVDATYQMGDQVFRFIGAAPFSGRPGEIGYVLETGRTRVEFHMDGDLEADAWFYVAGDLALRAEDFHL
jgi:Ca2+-binding RTX toxin-like protein